MQAAHVKRCNDGSQYPESPNCLSVDKCVNERQFNHTEECQSSVERHEALTVAMMLSTLGNIMGF